MTFPAGNTEHSVVAEDYEELPQGTPAWINLTAGAFAGIAEHSVTYPFDSIKTRMQVIQPHPEAIYKNTVDAFKRIAQSKEGLARLWRGVSSVVLGAGPAHALYFGTYEKAKSILLPEGGEAASHPVVVGLSGALATSVADGFMTPFDVIKQRMQVHGSPFKNVFACALDVYKREGIASFLVSYPTTLFLNIPFQLVQFPTYEYFRSKLGRSEYDPWAHVLSGGIAGGLAGAVTTPIDVVKTTLQTRGLFQGGKVNGMADAINFVYRERGLAGFSRGVAPRIMTFMPATAICWGFYEYLKWILKGKHDV